MASPLDKIVIFSTFTNHNIAHRQSLYRPPFITIPPTVGVHVIDLYLHKHSLGFFGARELDAVEGIAVFDDLKGFDHAFAFQVLKERYNIFAYATFNFNMSVFDTELFEHVGESNGRSQLLVKNNFLNAKHSIIFACDVHGSVLSRHVQKSSVI